MSIIRRFLSEDDGQNVVEVALILTLGALAAIVALKVIHAGSWEAFWIDLKLQLWPWLQGIIGPMDSLRSP